MSSQHYRWAWAQPLPCTVKSVLLNLVERANDEGECYPSIARIAADTGMNEKTAGTAVLKLKSLGLISVTKRHGHASMYTLNLNAQAMTTPNIGAPPKTEHPQIRGDTTPDLGGTTTPNIGGQNPPLNPPITPQVCIGPVDPPEKPANDPPAPTPKPRKRPLPDDFHITEGVRRWAEGKGYADLDAHFESFCLKCQAKGYQYTNWDAALKNAIRDDWAGIRAQQSHRNPTGGTRHETHQRPLSAFDRVRQSGIEYLRRHGEDNIIDITEYRTEKPANGEPVGEIDGDLWPSMDIAIR